jgi:PPOX class probable F420-dependent enzyme
VSRRWRRRVCLALDGETLYSAVDDKPKRSRRLKRLVNIRRHPDVSVTVDHYEEDWSRLWWVRMDGRAEVLEEGSELDRALARLADKYDQYRDEAPRGPAIAVRIDHWRGWHA